MRKRLVVAALFSAAGMLFLGGGASTQEATTPLNLQDDGAVEAHIPGELDPRAAIMHQRVVEHREQVVDHMQRIAQVQAEHEESQQEGLGSRAPTETFAPLATIPPVEPSS